MKKGTSYMPGPATGAEVEKSGEQWALVMVRELRHAPARVWQALTDPAQLREWAPYEADRSLATVGPVKLSTVGAPSIDSDSAVEVAEAGKRLEHTWVGNDLRWQLEPLGTHISASGGQATMIDGPYAEAKETIVSFAVLDLPTPEAAIELSHRFWEIHGDGEGDIRQIYGPE